MRGLNTKVAEFCASVSQEEFDIVVLTETWLKEEVNSSELFPNSYHVYRSDRKFAQSGTSRGGGVLLACKSSIRSERLNLSNFDVFPSVDIVGCRLVVDRATFCILALYIPPNMPINLYSELFQEMYSLEVLLSEKFLVLGDYNMPDFHDVNNFSAKKQLVTEFQSFYNLKQCNSVCNSLNRILDLVFSNFDCVIVRDNNPLVAEDLYHPALHITFEVDIKSKKFVQNRNVKRYNFRKANYIELYNSILETDWSFLNMCEDLDMAMDLFYQKVYSVFDLHVPLYRDYKRKYPKWYGSELINNIKLKSYNLRKYKQTNLNIYLVEYKNLRKNIKLQIDMAYKNYLSNIQNSIHDDPNVFWSYINAKKDCTRIPGKMTYADQELDTPGSIVNAFADYFGSVYRTPSVQALNGKYEGNTSGDIFSMFFLDSKDVEMAIKKLKPKLTSGYDNVPAFIVRDCGNVFANPLKTIFNISLRLGTFPTIWKTARVCPIFKNGDVSDVTSYRPVALLSSFAKVFEIALHGRIYSATRNLLSPYQHGFVANKSTVTNLVTLSQFLSNALDNNYQVDVIYTDISKAFDRINPNVFIKKIAGLGFNNKLIDFLFSYLINRKYFVSYNAHMSDCYHASLGVPQGSNLGPLIFLLYINDLTYYLDCERLLFADDLKIYCLIESVNDCQRLQKNLDRVSSWCEWNGLHLNSAKCKVVTYSNKKNNFRFEYRVNSQVLSCESTIKDLGVTFDTKLSFTAHIYQIKNDATKMLGFIIRNCRTFTNVDCLKVLYYSYVRSKLEYADIVWNPHYDVHKKLLENTQRRFLKFLFYKSSGSYPVRGIDEGLLLSQYDVQSLEVRRCCHNIKFLHKLLNNLIDSPYLLQQLKFVVPRLESRNNVTFYMPFPRTNIALRSPLYSMCKLYNSISAKCDISADSVDSVIRHLCDHFSSIC